MEDWVRKFKKYRIRCEDLEDNEFYAGRLDDTITPFMMWVGNREADETGEYGDWVVFDRDARYLMSDTTFRWLFEPMNSDPEVPYGVSVY